MHISAYTCAHRHSSVSIASHLSRKRRKQAQLNLAPSSSVAAGYWTARQLDARHRNGKLVTSLRSERGQTHLSKHNTSPLLCESSRRLLLRSDRMLRTAVTQGNQRNSAAATAVVCASQPRNGWRSRQQTDLRRDEVGRRARAAPSHKRVWSAVLMWTSCLCPRR